MMLLNRVVLSYLLLLGFVGFWSCQTKKTVEKSKKDSVVIKKDTITVSKQPKITEVELRMIEQGLVDIQTLDSTIMVELKYSTTDNFVKADVYGDLTHAYLQQKPAEMLVEANKILQQKYPNYRLLVYDAARPLAVQHTLWNLLDTIPPKKREDFVANPAIASIHNYGSAVDLTVYDLESKQPLDMGTKYDFFGYLAYPRLETKMLKEGKLTEQQIANRKVLREAMIAAGYMRIESEWWHFNAISRAKAKSLYKIIE
ncbi:MAG: M15 family metallopeptidase [Emticicia sp.]|uniref:M15 family metallopeptidase n=1 Tax=Emticicia sp. TaxID=1930953 RepID=UPI003BA4A7EC